MVQAVAEPEEEEEYDYPDEYVAAPAAPNPVLEFFSSVAEKAQGAIASAADDAKAEAQRRIESTVNKLQALPGELADAAQAKVDETVADIAATPARARDKAARKTLSVVEEARDKVEAAKRKRDALK